MRRLLVAALVVVLSSVAGCATTGPPTDVPPTGAAETGATGPAGGGNSATVCAAAQQAGATALRTYVEEVGRMVAAIGANDSATAEAARRRAEAALTGWRATLRQQSDRAADPELKTLLSDMETEVAAMGADVDAIDESELDRLQQRLDQLCPR
ncbi:hypothetical protein ACFOOK_07715 [Micromonospora krabiensis]|uniref:Uncharacterized protein n=1 Tax=Micromonospora krabiensis TaxID=307121 RepID=A0A1C3NBY6_9ACTN|nr:hypothetical protein [Micromonospora krabiensis]SBV30112.1 hypothetical protein GA0070620_5705 [Micromonospora krabiensis]